MFGLIIWILCGIASFLIAKGKGRDPVSWFLIGILAGPFGIIIALVISPLQENITEEAINYGGMKKCPFCAELIKSEAIKCRYCGSEITPLPVLDPKPAMVRKGTLDQFFDKVEERLNPTDPN